MSFGHATSISPDVIVMAIVMVMAIVIDHYIHPLPIHEIQERDIYPVFSNNFIEPHLTKNEGG